MHIYKKSDIPVQNSFIDKFAQRYIDQRSKVSFNLTDLDKGLMFKGSGFDSSLLEGIIKKNSVAHDFAREKGKTPLILNDIYRSDLGELLMTYYFEEKTESNLRFVIPLKNISFRERADLPGRGLDAIGYRIDENNINILLGEAKVSSEKNSPPAVVDRKNDSIYKTQKKHNDNLSTMISRLTDYCRRLGAKDAEIIGLAILNMEHEKTALYSITFGCALIRDFTCVNEPTDYGKLKTNTSEFNPNKIHFSILSFTEKEIDETVTLFYNKVQELIK